MNDFLAALTLLLIIEGALYALFPGGMKRMMEQVLPLPENTLRGIGLAAAVFGLGCLWLVRG